MAEYRIPVAWEMYGRVTIEAESLEEAIKKAWDDPSIGLDQVEGAEYVMGSWQVDEEIAFDDYGDEEQKKKAREALIGRAIDDLKGGNF